VVKPVEERACVSTYRTRVEDGVVCIQIPAEESDAPALVSSGNLGGDAE